MKIFLVGDFPKDDKTYTGVQGVLVNLVDELITRQNIELVLISLTTECDLRRYVGVCTVHKLKFRSSFFSARKKFNEIVSVEKPDVIHLQDVVPGVLLYRKNYKKRFVVTQHAILKEEILWQASLKRKMLFRGKELIEKYYFRKLENIIFISEYNQKFYFENAPSKKMIRHQLIPNPVSKVFFQNQTPSIVQNENELYFVGEIKKRKGLHILIRALQMLKIRGCACKLHVIGGFKEKSYQKEIMDLIASLGLTDSIIFCGWKSQTEIMEYSKNISVFVLPSFQETLPLSIAEAMCQGKIVVATDICGIPEMIDDGSSGYLFTPGNSEQLASVLGNIFGNIKHQKKISNKAVLMRKSFNSKKIVDQTIDFYTSMLTEH